MLQLVQDGEMILSRYIYSFRNVEMIINGTSYTFEDGTVVYASIQHDYTNRRFPIIRIGIEADADLIQKYFTYQKTVKLKLDIYEQQVDQDDQIVNSALYLRHIFDTISVRDQTTYVTTPNDVSKELIDPMRTLQCLELYLIDMEIVNTFAKEISLAVDKASKSAMLQSLFVSRDILPGVVIATPPINDIELSNPSVSLGDLVDNIDELNRGYGLYDTYPVIYHDYQYLYCISQYTPNIIIKSASEFGNVTFMLVNTDNPRHNITGSCNDLSRQTHVINLKDMPQIINVSDRDTSTKFSTVITVGSTGTVSKQTVDSQATKAHFVRELNELTQQQMIHQNLYGHRVILSVNDCALSCLKPYKTVTFDVDTQYSDKGLTGHDYRITGMVVNFTRDGNKRYIHNTTVSLICPTHESNTV